jgi:hypothetical protein
MQQVARHPIHLGLHSHPEVWRSCFWPEDQRTPAGFGGEAEIHGVALIPLYARSLVCY